MMLSKMTRIFSILLGLSYANALFMSPAKPNVLLFNSWLFHLPGGGSNHFLFFHKVASEGGFMMSTELLTGEGSFQVGEAARLGLSCNVFEKWKAKEHDILKIYKKKQIDFVTLPYWHDLEMVKNVAKKVPMKVIFVMQGTVPEDLKANIDVLRGVDGIVGHNQDMTDYFTWANKKYNLGIKKIATIAPCWDEDRIEHALKSINIHETRQQFFKRRFHISLNNEWPMICTIANMADPVKNQELLLQALNVLVNIKRKNVYVMFAGEGSRKGFLEKLTKDLGLSRHVFFLGSINDAPALLHYSDMHVLPSYAEGFPVVNIEAGYMGKPIIVAADTGGAHLIKNKETGLLFKNRDSADLARQIEYLLDFPAERQKFGYAAAVYVRDNFLNKKLLKQWEDFFLAFK